MDELSRSINEGNITVFVDVAKAFDTVDHKVVVVGFYLTTNQRHLGYLSSGTWQEDTAPLRFKRADAIGCSR